MVEVFKTNVQGEDRAKMLVDLLLEHFPGSKVNFDLEDCDRILRVNHTECIKAKVKQLLHNMGFFCEELPD